MWSWLRKRFGITPELIEYAKRLERSATLRAEQKPYAVHRLVLVLLAREKCIAWHNQWIAHTKQPAVDPVRDRWLFARAYLVNPSAVDDKASLDNLIKKNRQFFLEAFVNSYQPRRQWPWVPKETEFDEWFEAHQVSYLWDMEREAIEKEPDIISEINHDL